ncbi:MAG: BamA/TamA family outer membrane protein [Paraprevotella sp.]|nr:BamA/TamA family outer membrane protein [Paraprevotella sp.]
MRKAIIYYICVIWVVTSCVLTGCSTTKNLPEDEVLYIGIEEITYGEKVQKRKERNTTEEGVITSFAEAYKSIDEAFNQKNLSALRHETLSKEQLDSIKEEQRIESEAYHLAKTEVEAALAYAPNNSLFGSSSLRFPFPSGLWLYNSTVGKESRLSKWIFNNFAATPVYISSVNPDVRTLVAQNTLHNYGYFNGTVKYEILPQKNPRKAKISYTVLPGKLYRLDSIAYLNFTKANDSIIRRNYHKRTLFKGDPFSVINLDAERTRLHNLFRNSGYFYHKPEYITFRADTIQRQGFVQLQVVPSPQMPSIAQKKFYLGNTTIQLYNESDYRLTDTLNRRDFTLHYKKDKKGKAPLRLGAMRRNFFYRKGMPYHQDIMSFVQEQLSGMDVFSSVNLKYAPRDTTDNNDTLDIIVTATLDKAYDGEFTTKVTSKSNGQVGPGLSFSLAKRNAFRGAEKLKFEVHGSYEWQTKSNVVGKSSVINSFEYGTSLSLDYPRLIFPGARKLSRRARTGTSFILDATWLNRANYFSMVSFSGRISYSYQARPTLKHEFTPFRLDYDKLLSATHTFDSIMKANPALYISMRDQFVPSMMYRFTYSSRRNARNPRSFIFEVKESGNVMSGLYAAFGKPFHQKDKMLFGVPFAQYLRFSAEFREEFRLTPRTSIATRIGTGVIYSYGNSTAAPYNDLFCVGGANSIRAFTVRGIGPGSYTPGDSEFSYIDQMGDFKIELNAEYRFPIVSILKGAIFLDAGNVWLLNADENRRGGTFDISRFGKDLALGTGAGLRLDLDFLILRFDVGVGIHAPYNTGKSGYYNMPRFKDSLGYHFAVGYPF